MKNNSGFTLIEVLVSVALTGMILVTGYNAFQSIMTSQGKLAGTIDIQKNLFYLNEKITSLIRQGGVIDYEEYFNRKMLGYIRDGIDIGGDGQPDIWSYTAASSFGNGSEIYLCQVESTGDENACLGNNAVKDNLGAASTLSGQQRYNQYASLSRNHGSILGFPTPNKLPPILGPAESQGLPELYLVKKLTNGTYERTFFRHVFVSYPGTSCNISTGEKCLGKIQMTKLISCDIAPFDGVIDVWIPHIDFGGGKCDDVTIATIENAADSIEWVDISSPDMNVKNVTFLPSPLKVPELMSGSGEEALSPSIQMRIEIALSDTRAQKAFSKNGETRVLMTTLHLHE